MFLFNLLKIKIKKMKNYIILFVAVLLYSCSSDVTIVTWDDPKSIAINQHMENYINKDFDAMKDLFTDDFQVVVSGQDEPYDLDGVMEAVNLHHMLFSNIYTTIPGAELEEGKGVISQTISYPTGETWSQIWFNWHAIGNYTGDTVVNMVHLSYKWEGNKIVEEYHFSDGAAFNKEVTAYNNSLEEMKIK